jgi:hypothetical protein
VRTTLAVFLAGTLALTLSACDMLGLGGEPNFWVIPDSENWELSAGPDANYFSLAIYRVAGFIDPVTLSAPIVPTGIAVEFEPNPVEGFSAVVRVETEEGWEDGQITIRGVGGELIREAVVTVTILGL